VTALRTIYRYWLTLVWLAVVVQITFAAYGGFYAADKLGDQKGSDETKMISEKVYDHGFGLHNALGYLIFLGSVVLLLLALGARVGRRRILLSLAVVAAVALQIVLAWISEAVHGFGFLHGLNALVLFGLTGSMTGMAWRRHRAGEEAAAPASAPA
jgi:hypothetical protein